MNTLTMFTIIAAIIIIGYFSELLFKRTGIPDVLILITIGIFLRHYFEIIHPDNFGGGASLFATFTLVYLLFQGAMAIDFKTLFNSVKEASLLTIISFVFTVIITSILSMILFGLNIQLALLFGMIVGGISSAVVIPLVNMLPLNKKHGSTLMLESAISDVLCIVGAMTMMNIILSGEISGTQIFKEIISSFSLALVVGGIIGVAWIFTLFKFKNLRRAHVVTIAVVIALYAFVESPFVDASGAIAALAFGLILGNSKTILSLNKTKTKQDSEEIINVLSKSAQSFFSEISFFVKVFFFVYLGALMDFTNPIIFITAGIIVFSMYMIRPLSVKLAYRKQKLDDYSRTNLEILIPKGLAAAVLVNVTIQAGVPGTEQLAPPILAIILISIVLTSVLVPLTNKGYFKGFAQLFKKKTTKKIEKS
ncbi:cation:proton antiporter [Candidatus Woesearchaeota archaeon]|nr:cation:proton antiporter [Candidatus Woesearchaeota archaeon]